MSLSVFVSESAKVLPVSLIELQPNLLNTYFIM